MPETQRKRVLIVDQNEDNRSILKIILARIGDGIEIREAVNLKEAEGILATTRDIDLVITELPLPEDFWAGLDVIRGARERYPDLPIICFTSSVMQDAEKKALRAGADLFVPKPPQQFKALESLIRGFLGVARTSPPHLHS